EYQDTNFPQYGLIRKLAHPKNNVCAVGDDDQSIYRWRGADVENILNFSKDFPGTRVIKLEQNYRSTQNILDGAHGVVENLLGRHPKKLWTNKGQGEKITYFLADDESSEASFVVREINSMLGQKEPSDFAVLFRTNAQSRSFEEALGRHKIPYQLIGGTRFYDRKEIKDILAYVQFAVNMDDIVSLRRIINNPSRGIGDVTITKLEAVAVREGISSWEAITEKMSFLDVTPTAKSALNKFKSLIQSIKDSIDHGESPSQVIDFVLKESEYLNALLKEGTDEAIGRIDNIKELIASAKSFEIGNPDAGTMEYLDQVSLVADTDSYEAGSPRATLMTLHCAKGLEFEIVFLVGMEDGLLPHSRNSNDPDLLEEERRLCYVGMTRAKEKLFLVGARSRRTFNGTIVCNPSRFLIDVPLSALDERGLGRLARKKRLTTVGSNIDNISKFFKEKQIPVDMSKLEKHSAARGQGEFRKGDHVLLTKYGKGTIVATEGEGEEL
ncbi:MAG: UvrD-helicase domain-containing protein, partial [Chlorobiales bacterium]|nr:UvrD-helicase domain-containing protein [Chlorobiales bacterium]